MKTRDISRVRAELNYNHQYIMEDGRKITPSEYLEQTVNEGFTILKTKHNGAAKNYLLFHKDGTFKRFRRKVEAEYLALLSGVTVKDEAPLQPAPAGVYPQGQMVVLHDRSVLNASREDIAFTILQNPQYYPIQGKYKYLIGRTRFCNPVALVWEPGEKICLGIEMYNELWEEVHLSGLSNKKLRVYGRLCSIASNNMEFYQLPLFPW